MIMSVIRERFHPLYRARQVPIIRELLARADKPIWRKLDDITFPVRVRAVRHATYIVTGRSPERGLSALIRALVATAPPARFCDVGANFGYYGLLVKSLSPHSEVLLIEAEPDNVALIEATMERGSHDGVELHALALSDERGNAMFFRDRVSGSTGSLETIDGFATRNWSAPKDELRVEVSTLDVVMGGRPIDLVKIDVEGHEESVLCGATEVLKRDQPILLVECFHSDGRLERLLEPYGYRMLDADRITPAESRTTNLLAWTPCRDEEVARACELARRFLGGDAL